VLLIWTCGRSAGSAGRLVAETGPDGDTGYSYDAAGQLRQRRRGANVTEYDYDPAGRRTSEAGPDRTRTFTWSPRGELTGIHSSGSAGQSSTTLTVDAFGDLTEVNATLLCWDPTGHLPQLRRIGGTAVLGDDERAWATVNATGGVSWLDADWQHSVGSGTDPWGAAGSAGIGLGWRGELHVDGLSWLHNRAYDPTTRAFLSPDPLPPVPADGAKRSPPDVLDRLPQPEQRLATVQTGC